MLSLSTLAGMPDLDASTIPDLSGRTVVVTGASSGIGEATAARLAVAGARVVLAVRNADKGEAAARRMTGTVEVRPLDLASLDSIRSFAETWDTPIDVLINNAGVSARTLQRTTDGFELDFGTNHLGHFALTLLLLRHLTGRVVTVASQAERAARLDLEDPNWERRVYQPGQAYNDSKLANLLFTAEMERRLRADGSSVRALAAHPGLVTTAIYDRAADAPRTFWDRILPVLGQDAAHGALPVLFAATQDVPSGSFAGPRHLMHMRGGAQRIGRSARAKDPLLARRLWDISEELTHTAYPAERP
jgi:NAD(P)-dependent dehydrogenase (short-subunit alcohol dehydrogenase family)